VRLLLPTALLAICISSMASAQQPAAPVPTIHVTANATLRAKPDRVEIDIGVVTQGAQADPTAAENATHVVAVLAALRNIVPNETDIKTFGYALTPDYRYPSAGAQPEITGYTATNLVQVTLDDLQKMGAVIDAATRSGANRVQDIRFTLRDPEGAHLQALRKAADAARREADTLASTLNVRIVRVLSVEEGGGFAIPIRPLRPTVMRAEVAREATPVEAGTLDVNANVTLAVEVDGHQGSNG
jgi:uncharacterized protein